MFQDKALKLQKTLIESQCILNLINLCFCPRNFSQIHQSTLTNIINFIRYNKNLLVKNTHVDIPHTPTARRRTRTNDHYLRGTLTSLRKALNKTHRAGYLDFLQRRQLLLKNAVWHFRPAILAAGADYVFGIFHFLHTQLPVCEPRNFPELPVQSAESLLDRPTLSTEPE